MNGYLPLAIDGVMILALVAFVFKTNKAVKDESDTKRGRVYERLDEHKDYIDSTFVRQEMCNVLHKQTADKVIEISIDVKKLLELNGHD